MLFTAGFVTLAVAIPLQLILLLPLAWIVVPIASQLFLDFKVELPGTTIALMDLLTWIAGEDQLIPGWICFAIWELGLVVVMWGMVGLGAVWGTDELERVPRLLRGRCMPDIALWIGVGHLILTVCLFAWGLIALTMPLGTMMCDLAR